mgnify:CR=1 FL=1
MNDSNYCWWMIKIIEDEWFKLFIRFIVDEWLKISIRFIEGIWLKLSIRFIEDEWWMIQIIHKIYCWRWSKILKMNDSDFP